ncbi:hypothetical protein [Paraburkholderia unamae]|uniref:Uncharacterized protein n=1 Tax=Paraburkholderia unamae TaxID=219649 RepID=A0ACC6RH59_9BURK
MEWKLDVKGDWRLVDPDGVGGDSTKALVWFADYLGEWQGVSKARAGVSRGATAEEVKEMVLVQYIAWRVG